MTVCTVHSSVDRTSRCNKVDAVRLYAFTKGADERVWQEALPIPRAAYPAHYITLKDPNPDLRSNPRLYHYISFISNYILKSLVFVFL